MRKHYTQLVCIKWKLNKFIWIFLQDTETGISKFRCTLYITPWTAEDYKYSLPYLKRLLFLAITYYIFGSSVNLARVFIFDVLRYWSMSISIFHFSYSYMWLTTVIHYQSEKVVMHRCSKQSSNYSGNSTERNIFQEDKKME